jgi:eukaryotic-like serine/threonine-protein kinase
VPFAGANHAEVVVLKERGEFTPASALNASVPSDLDLILERMLARDPRHRFQTASELVVVLEHSRLADRLPSFVDMEVALQDPEARARLVSNGQPTRPDLGRPPAPVSPDPDATPLPRALAPAEVWHLRFRDARGQWFSRRATTNQILHGQREGYWPAGVEAARGSNRRYRPLEVYPEFRSPDVPPRAHSAAPKANPKPPADDSVLPSVRQWQVLLSTGFGVGLLAAAALFRLLMTL